MPYSKRVWTWEFARLGDARYSLVTEKGAAVFAARSVLPDYMSVSNFRDPAPGPDP